MLCSCFFINYYAKWRNETGYRLQNRGEKKGDIFFLREKRVVAAEWAMYSGNGKRVQIGFPLRFPPFLWQKV